eukprot:6203539-Pleurochrysis_carterae.AAC.1
MRRGSQPPKTVWLRVGTRRASKKSLRASSHARCAMCIFPPHSRMTPMILGCGMADLRWRRHGGSRA